MVEIFAAKKILADRKMIRPYLKFEDSFNYFYYSHML